ncbi:MAG TPA: hypothetical protein VE569_04995, partial [Acidimicrobiia bacterium]|nr:hypothetical protein [Acidimicrobiia bacterium]
LLVSSGFTSVPEDNPCQPAQLDSRDPDSPLVQAYEVTLRAENADYRFVAIDGTLHSCTISAAPRPIESPPTP